MPLTDAGREAAQLKLAISGHLGALRAQRERHPFLDLDLVEALGERFGAILDRWGDWDDVQRAAVREAVAYLVDSDDEEHDLRSPIGLVDDEERLATLERLLGLG